MIFPKAALSGTVPPSAGCGGICKAEKSVTAGTDGFIRRIKMQKYYVFETAIANGQQANMITVKEDRMEALMLFHQIRASSLANPAVSYSLTMVLDYWGNEVIKESYQRPDPEPEPTE